MKGKMVLKVINTLVFIALAMYVYGMFIYPWVAGGWSFDKVHSVWMSWQALNVGVLALISSVVFFVSTKYSDRLTRSKLFESRRSLLPNALSELNDYLIESGKYLEKCLYALRNKGGSMGRPKVELNRPEVPDRHEEVFKSCIEYGNSDVGKLLSGILIRLQVFNSRLKSVEGYFSGSGNEVQMKVSIKKRMCDLAEIFALIQPLYDVGRGKGMASEHPLSYNNMIQAFRNLNIDAEVDQEMMSLIEGVVKSGGMMSE